MSLLHTMSVIDYLIGGIHMIFFIDTGLPHLVWFVEEAAAPTFLEEAGIFFYTAPGELPW